MDPQKGNKMSSLESLEKKINSELTTKIKNTKIQIVNKHKPIKISIDNMTPKEVAIPLPPLNLSQIGKQCPKTKK